jgi:hypothetical protein
MLNRHPQLLVTNELMTYRGQGRYLGNFRRRLVEMGEKYPHIGIYRKTFPGEKHLDFFGKLKEMNYQVNWQSVINLLIKHAGGKYKYYGDKYTTYVFDLREFNLLLKKPKIIMCIRDPRDVLESQLRNMAVKRQATSLHKNGLTVEEAMSIHPWIQATVEDCFNPPKKTKTWLDFMKEWEVVKKELDMDYYELYYRNIVADASAEATRVADFLDIDGAPMVEIFERDFKPPRHEVWKEALPDINNKLPESWKQMMKKYGFNE